MNKYLVKCLKDKKDSYTINADLFTIVEGSYIFVKNGPLQDKVAAFPVKYTIILKIEEKDEKL